MYFTFYNTNIYLFIYSIYCLFIVYLLQEQRLNFLVCVCLLVSLLFSLTYPSPTTYNSVWNMQHMYVFVDDADC